MVFNVGLPSAGIAACADIVVFVRAIGVPDFFAMIAIPPVNLKYHVSSIDAEI